MQRQDLFSAFESLGNNCEFGMVQEAAGCRGLSLFKNVGFDAAEQMIDAIDAGLAGMFEEGAYEFVSPNGWPDYALDCRRFGFRFHTALPIQVQDAAVHFETLLRAFRWLRDKFLQDLRDGEKIFTFRHQLQFNEALAERFAATIRRHGPGWLLWVREDDRADRRFAWAEASGVSGLLFGGMPRLSTESPPRVAYDAWEQIAIRALRLRRGDDRPSAPTNGAVARLMLGGNEPEPADHILTVVPGSILLVHTWVWLSASFNAGRVDIVATGGEVEPGSPVNVSIIERWQPCWTRVRADQQRVTLRFSAPGGERSVIYTTGWTVRRMPSADHV